MNRYHIENEQLYVEFVTHGAECVRLYDKKQHIEYLWNGNPEFWGRHAPILFPTVGRLQNDTYHIGQNTYHMGQHGFARDLDFDLHSQSDDKICFILKSSAETKEMYPYDFELCITYTLKDNVLNVAYQVHNLNDDVMPFGIGGHPAFCVPLTDDTSFEDYVITVKTATETCLRYPLNGPFIDFEHRTIEMPWQNQPLSHSLFEHDAIIYETPGDTEVLLHNHHDNHRVKLSYDHCRFVGIWSPYPKEAPFVCIEPWNGIADTTKSDVDFDQKFGIQHIEPHEMWHMNYQISVQ